MWKKIMETIATGAGSCCVTGGLLLLNGWAFWILIAGTPALSVILGSGKAEEGSLQKTLFRAWALGVGAWTLIWLGRVIMAA